MLDFDECDRARVSRNRAYDGHFFTGVRTTGIYCRPVCPVRPAQGRNVEYYPSAAAAEAAGYRPCLRCRPEVAPFSPAWKGSLTTVERAMRLVDEGALDDGGVEALASRLGIGARHLGRLFARHVGASPTQVARTARIQRAKRLIDMTDLAMTEIALSVGFRSLRRFNAVFAEIYQRPPTAIRRQGRPSEPHDHDGRSAAERIVAQAIVVMKRAQMSVQDVRFDGAVTWPSNGLSEVPFRVYTDPEQYAREQETIFKGESWSYRRLAGKTTNLSA